jgi:hypothetical protein
MHVRRRDDGECIGCIEVGLYEIVRSIVLAEGASSEVRDNERGGNDAPA